jgi:hypothetical protein
MPKKSRSEAAKRAWESSDEWNISTVMADLPQSVEIGKRNTKQSMKIKIWSGTELIGTLSIGQGGVQWSFGNKKYPLRKWHDFAERMT